MTQTRHNLSDLFTQYLRKQAGASEQGLGFAETTGEVLPHDATPVQPVDPALAWKDAVAAANGTGRSWVVPAEWPQLVAAQEPAVAIAFALGNFPQLVRNLQPLLTGGDLTKLRGSINRPATHDGLVAWATTVREQPQKLLAAGVLRLARHFDKAADLLQGATGELKANEEAALLWHRGQFEEAAKAWQAQEATTAVLFNRGMSALFLGRPADAHASLTQATAQMPETTAWHHLGRLYLALAEARR